MSIETMTPDVCKALFPIAPVSSLESQSKTADAIRRDNRFSESCKRIPCTPAAAGIGPASIAAGMKKINALTSLWK